jgi:hypothetical protein
VFFERLADSSEFDSFQKGCSPEAEPPYQKDEEFEFAFSLQKSSPVGRRQRFNCADFALQAAHTQDELDVPRNCFGFVDQ